MSAKWSILEPEQITLQLFFLLHYILAECLIYMISIFSIKYNE